MNRSHLARLVVLFVSAAMVGCTVARAQSSPSVPTAPAVETIRVKLPAGDARVDLYWPKTAKPAPLVIVAHGFSRHRRNMSGWGRHLANAGLVAAVPDLPAWSDHARNGRFLSELRAHLCAGEPWKRRIDPSRVGLMGFSAGGLSTLLSAAESPGLAIWVGLDPVDRDGMGAKAAPRVQCNAVVLMAEPSACNAQGNARDLIAALPHCEHSRVPGAVHVDAEWPTSGMAEFVCGRSTQERRSEFRRLATAVLLHALARPPAAGEICSSGIIRAQAAKGFCGQSAIGRNGIRVI
jgi:dienelactone hydrolase